MSSKLRSKGSKQRIPFKVKMEDGSITVIHAYSEKQALFLASREGKRAVKIVGIGEEEEVKGGEGLGGEKLASLLREYGEALGLGDFLRAMKCKAKIREAVAAGEIAWTLELERRYRLFSRRP